MIKKTTLSEKGWYIQYQANRWDNQYRRNGMSRPYVVGYCPVCDVQHILDYIGQTNEAFVFECIHCKGGSE